MEPEVINAITNRLDELESQIRPLEREYRILVNHLFNNGQVAAVEGVKICIDCGKHDVVNQFHGDRCMECYIKAKKEANETQSHKSRVKLLKTIQKVRIDETLEKSEYGRLLEIV